MDDSVNGRIYPSAPLEQPIDNEQKQKLLPQTPPSYEQAIQGAPPNPGAIINPAVMVAPSGGQPPQQHTTIVITSNGSYPFGPEPMDIQCPYCHNYIRTRLRYKPTSRTHLFALLLCLFQLYCCVCLPYCIGSCMSTAHYCGICDRYLGTYIRP